MGISVKRRLFVEEYLRCWSATEAARIAGYRAPTKRGYEALHDPQVAALVAARIAEAAMGADEVLHRLAEMARGSMADFVDERGNIDLERAREAGKLHLLKNYSEPGEKSGGRIELYDAQAALEKLGKNLGLFRDRVELLGGMDVRINWDGTDDNDQREAAPGAEVHP